MRTRCRRICDHETVAASGWLDSVPRLHVDSAHERAMEADVRPVVREGVGKNRMGPDDVAAHRDRSVDVRGSVPDSSDGDAGRGAAHRLSRWRHLSVRAAWRTVPNPRSAHDGAAGMGRTLLAGGAIAGAASVAAEDSASSVKVYSNPRERCMRS